MQMSDVISELAKMGYDLNDEQDVHVMILSLPNEWNHIKMVLCQSESVVTFEDVGQHLEVEKERQETMKNDKCRGAHVNC